MAGGCEENDKCHGAMALLCQVRLVGEARLGGRAGRDLQQRRKACVVTGGRACVTIPLVGGQFGGVLARLFGAAVELQEKPESRTFASITAIAAIRTPFAFANALLLTGKRAYVDVWRNVIDTVNANAQQEDDRTLYPHMYGRLDRLVRLERGESLDDLPVAGPTGWYEFRPEKFAPSAEALWYWTLDQSALELMGQAPRWVRYLDGEDSSYPEAALRAELETVRSKVAGMRADHRALDMSMSDDMNHLNPATIEVLIQLMLGGIPTGRDVATLHTCVRYFDPVRRRAGLPEHVGARVERISEVTLQLVNLNPVEARVVMVQGGAYAEHQIARVQSTPVDHSHFTLRLAPGAGTRLTLSIRRYVNQPTFAFPWV